VTCGVGVCAERLSDDFLIPDPDSALVGVVCQSCGAWLARGEACTCPV